MNDFMRIKINTTLNFSIESIRVKLKEFYIDMSNIDKGSIFSYNRLILSSAKRRRKWYQRFFQKSCAIKEFEEFVDAVLSRARYVELDSESAKRAKHIGIKLGPNVKVVE